MSTVVLLSSQVHVSSSRQNDCLVFITYFHKVSNFDWLLIWLIINLISLFLYNFYILWALICFAFSFFPCSLSLSLSLSLFFSSFFSLSLSLSSYLPPLLFICVRRKLGHEMRQEMEAKIQLTHPFKSTHSSKIKKWSSCQSNIARDN